MFFCIYFLMGRRRTNNNEYVWERRREVSRICISYPGWKACRGKCWKENGIKRTGEVEVVGSSEATRKLSFQKWEVRTPDRKKWKLLVKKIKVMDLQDLNCGFISNLRKFIMNCYIIKIQLFSHSEIITIILMCATSQ